MIKTMPSHRLIYALTAILLLMQAFAVWHDTSHPFHIAEAQCQQFESISHTPTLDLASLPSPQFIAQLTTIEPVFTLSYHSKRLREHHAIRAPPVFS